MNFQKIAVGCSYVLFILYFSLILSLFYFFDLELFWEKLISPRTLFSIRLSIITASSATIISAIVGIPTAYALSRYKFRGKGMVETLLELPMIVSPAVLGAMLLIFFNNPIGAWPQSHGPTFVFSVYGIILAQFLSTAGVSTRLIKTVMDEVPKRYEEVARSLGANQFTAFKTVTLPLCGKGILAAMFLTWAKALGEFGATITIAESMAMKTETIPIAIYMRLSSAEIEEAVVLILILIGTGLGALYGARFLTRAHR